MKLQANGYLAWVESATPLTYNVIKGQGDYNESRSEPEIDTSSKETTGYSTGAFGAAKVSGDLAIRVDLPDTNGYTRLETLAKNKTAFMFQIRKNGVAGVTTDAVFECLVYASLVSRDYPKDGVVQAKFKIVLAAAPTIDALS
jgi:hypothetical protein